MLIEFRFKNYRSFRDETTLSMEATGLGTFKNSLIPYGSMNLLPGAAIFGKNGGGKSNFVSCAVHPKCAADTTRKSDNSGYSFCTQ